jgi:hypothetical protein
MATGLLIYAICASAVLIWGTLRGSGPKGVPQEVNTCIECVVIPHVLLTEWAHSCSNLVIFDLQADCKRHSRHVSIPGALTVSASELSSLITWLPPQSRVVFSCQDGRLPLDSRIERTLLHLGIEAVFVLDSNADSLRTATSARNLDLANWRVLQ